MNDEGRDGINHRGCRCLQRGFRTDSETIHIDYL